MRKYWIGILFFCFALTANAQVEMTFETDKEKVSVGDIMTWKYILKGYEGEKIDTLSFAEFSADNALNIKDSIYSESIDVEILKHNKLNDDLLVLQPSVGDTIEVKVAIYDIAVFTPPMPSISPEIDIKTNDLPVISVLPAKKFMQQDSIQINPIKDIFEEKPHWTDYIKPWHFLLLFIPLLIWLLFKYLPKKETPTPVEEPIQVPEKPAHEKALEQLEVLKEQRAWEGENKPYHTALTKIIRGYIQDRYGINALEMITDDTVQALREKDISTREVEQILNSADIVKFAKGQTGIDLNRQFLEDAFTFVNQTKEL